MAQIPISTFADAFEEADAAEPSRISRRDFGRHAAVVAALGLSSSTLIGCGTASVQDAKSGEKSGDKNSSGLTPEQAQEVDARLANIIGKYGNRLSTEQRQHLRRILTYNERMLASIRSFSLQNGDAPASVLKIAALSPAEPLRPSRVLGDPKEDRG